MTSRRINGSRSLNVNSQRGSVLLEALIGVLIFSVGVLALIAMQARAIQLSSDASYRNDAMFLANQVISEMWVVDKNTLKANFQTNGPRYNVWALRVQNVLPGDNVNAGILPPTIEFDAENNATITVFWRAPHEPVRPANDPLNRRYVTVVRITE